MTKIVPKKRKIAVKDVPGENGWALFFNKCSFLNYGRSKLKSQRGNKSFIAETGKKRRSWLIAYGSGVFKEKDVCRLATKPRDGRRQAES
jgi:hypothetical protein